MPMDFTMPPHVLELRAKVRAFIREEIEGFKRGGSTRAGTGAGLL